MAIEYVCEKCGSANVTSDAISQWSVKQQCWLVVGHYDSNECLDCGSESSLIERQMAEVV